MREVADGVFCQRGTDVNWVLVREGHDVTLIDAGWRGDAAAVEESVRAIGCRPEQIRAVLLTHAHIDHMGALERLHQRYATPVYMAAAEVEHARTGHLEQARPADLLPAMMRRPAAIAWLARIVRAGALHPIRAPHAAAFPNSGPLDLPGAPTPVSSPGHTSGHSAYLLAGARVLVTGDALITRHPLSPVEGPQLLPSLFSHEPSAALAALEALAGQPADVLLPGHGPPWRGDPAHAVALARDHAASSGLQRSPASTTSKEIS